MHKIVFLFVLLIVFSACVKQKDKPMAELGNGVRIDNAGSQKAEETNEEPVQTESGIPIQTTEVVGGPTEDCQP